MSAAMRLTCLALLVVGACKSAPEVKTEPTPTPKAEPLDFTGLEVTEQSLLEVTLALSGEVGPEVADRTLSWQATAGTAVLGEGEATLEVAPDGTFTVPLTLSFGSTLEDLAPYQSRKSFEVVVKGTLGPGSSSRSRAVRSPLLPVVSMTTVRASRNEARALSLTYLVTIHNPNPFEVPVRDLTYTAGLGGKTVATGSLPLGSRLPGSAQSMFELPAQLDESNAEGEFNKMLRATELEWSFSGKLDVRVFEIPFDLKGTLPIAQG